MAENSYLEMERKKVRKKKKKERKNAKKRSNTPRANVKKRWEIKRKALLILHVKRRQDMTVV